MINVTILTCCTQTRNKQIYTANSGARVVFLGWVLGSGSSPPGGNQLCRGTGHAEGVFPKQTPQGECSKREIANTCSEGPRRARRNAVFRYRPRMPDVAISLHLQKRIANNNMRDGEMSWCWLCKAAEKRGGVRQRRNAHTESGKPPAAPLYVLTLILRY